jgi:hypothetical protein
MTDDLFNARHPWRCPDCGALHGVDDARCECITLLEWRTWTDGFGIPWHGLFPVRDMGLAGASVATMYQGEDNSIHATVGTVYQRTNGQWDASLACGGYTTKPTWQAAREWCERRINRQILQGRK